TAYKMNMVRPIVLLEPGRGADL
ncbi:MAG: hypothetical protein QOF11_1690, partial [Chloroflexota bacterium]|nr:hypothetical protein [Chloroflexota bacterium]